MGYEGNVFDAAYPLYDGPLKVNDNDVYPNAKNMRRLLYC